MMKREERAMAVENLGGLGLDVVCSTWVRGEPVTAMSESDG